MVQQQPSVTDSRPSLRPACAPDAADLQRNCFPDQSLADVEGYLRWCLGQADKGRMVRLVAEVGGEAVASGQLAIHRDIGEIGSLVVAPAYRRRGIGTALVSALVSEARERGLRAVEIMADPGLSWLLDWYQELGFAVGQERTLPHDERVVVLQLTFKAAT